MNASTRLLILLALGAIGCAAQPAVEYPSSGPSTSYGSGSSVPSAPGVPARQSVTAGIVVRPDLLCVPFAIHGDDTDPEKALAAAQNLAATLSQHFATVAGGGSLRMRGVQVSPFFGKSKEDGPRYAVLVDGAFEVPLAASLDFWARSRLVAALISAGKKEPKELVFEPPQLRVADPELHRTKLVKQWVERAHAFGDAAQSPTAPLSLTDCTAPGEITQQSISAEEVALTLSVACKLDVRPK